MHPIEKISSVAGAIALVSDVDLVMEQARGRSMSVALLHQPATGKYAVCEMDFRRCVVSAPISGTRYDGARRAAVMDGEGLRRVLGWVDHEQAMSCFAALSRAPQARL